MYIFGTFEALGFLGVLIKIFTKLTMEETKVKEVVKNNKITNYVKGSFQELTKVTWPTKNQAVKLTAIVLSFCLLFSIFLTVVDFLANRGYFELLKLSVK